MAVQCDVSREDDVTRLFKVINDEHKGVDVCINNAGINKGAATLLDGDTSQWAEMLNVSTHGPSNVLVYQSIMETLQSSVK